MKKAKELSILIDLYDRVLFVVKYFLKEAEPVLTIVSVDTLRTINPSVAQMASTLRRLHSVIGMLANDSYEQEEIKINALQCVLLMEQIAIGIERSDNDRILDLITQLEKLINVPRTYTHTYNRGE